MPIRSLLAARRRPVRVPALGLAVTCALIGGCSDAETPFVRAPVAGTIVTGSKPLDAGMIRFVPIEGTKGPVATTAVQDGRYAFTADDGPVVGKHRIEVVPAADFLGFDPGDQQAAEQARRTASVRPQRPVPRRYAQRSPLTAVVPPDGHDNLDFLLTPNRRDLSMR